MYVVLYPKTVSWAPAGPAVTAGVHEEAENGWLTVILCYVVITSSLP